MAASGKPPETALWHDLECGGYEADLPLWRELADASDGELLELGCGTGRVALDLAGRGHGVWALDSERVLLAALRERVGDRLALQTVCADARSFTLEQRFGLCAIPMQTIQLLGGATGRRSCLARVRSHLRPAGLLAAAVVDLSGPWARDPEALPAADVCERGGVLYESQAVALRDQDGGVALERRRRISTPDGAVRASRHVERLDPVSGAQLRDEARREGFEALDSRHVPATDDYLGAEVVLLRA